MASPKSRSGFVISVEGQQIRRKLQQMTDDMAYNTASSYSANRRLYSNNRIPFVDKHMTYLVDHPSLDPDKYLANLRLATRIRKT